MLFLSRKEKMEKMDNYEFNIRRAFISELDDCVGLDGLAIACSNFPGSPASMDAVVEKIIMPILEKPRWEFNDVSEAGFTGKTRLKRVADTISFVSGMPNFQLLYMLGIETYGLNRFTPSKNANALEWLNRSAVIRQLTDQERVQKARVVGISIATLYRNTQQQLFSLLKFRSTPYGREKSIFIPELAIRKAVLDLQPAVFPWFKGSPELADLGTTYEYVKAISLANVDEALGYSLLDTLADINAAANEIRSWLGEKND